MPNIGHRCETFEELDARRQNEGEGMRIVDAGSTRADEMETVIEELNEFEQPQRTDRSNYIFTWDAGVVEVKCRSVAAVPPHFF